jgi:hypothetical protein
LCRRCHDQHVSIAKTTPHFDSVLIFAALHDENPLRHPIAQRPYVGITALVAGSLFAATKTLESSLRTTRFSTKFALTLISGLIIAKSGWRI